VEDSIKQKLLKLNHMPVTEFKKAGVFIGILYFGEYIDNPILYLLNDQQNYHHTLERLAILEGSGRMEIPTSWIQH